MHTIKDLLARYSGWIWALLKPLGAWGVFGIGFIDSAAWGMPLDAVVAGYVYASPRLAWAYCLMAAAGSALGSLFIYWVGRKGGELTLEKRVGKARLDRWRNRFEKQEFFALAIPALLPPPTPFKLLVLAAGAFEMYVRDFLLAIFLGRLLRFALLSVLVIKFGPQVVNVVSTVVLRHPWLSLTLAILVGSAIAVWFTRNVLRRR